MCSILLICNFKVLCNYIFLVSPVVSVWLISTLNWSMQVNEVCKKSGYSILKVLSLCKYLTLLQLYLAYIHPYLEYAAHVWDPHQQGLINSLQRVQKFALKVCTRNWSSDYESLLQLCNLPTLASRRHYLKLCLLYQVVNGHINFPMAPVAPRNLSRPLRNTRTLALERPVTQTNAYQSSFFPHTITLWNSLPPSA